MKSKSPLSFASTLVLTLTLSSLIVILAVFFFQRQESRAWFADIAEKSLTERSKFTAHQIEMYLDKPRQAVNLITHLARFSGDISSTSIQQELQHVLSEDFPGPDSVTRIGIATSGGEYIAYEKRTDGKGVVLIKTSPAKDHQLNVYASSQESATIARRLTNYNLYSRPWFIRATTQLPPFWSRKNSHMSTNASDVMTWRQPVYSPEREFVGVIFADITPMVMDTFLYNHAASDHSVILLVDENHQPVASSQRMAEKRLTPEMLNGSGKINSTASGAMLSKLDWSSFRVQKTQDTRGKYNVIIRPVHDASRQLNWSLVVIQPDNPLSANGQFTHTRYSLLLAMLIIVLLLNILFLVRRFFTPFNQLVRKVRLLGRQPWQIADHKQLYPEVAILEKELSHASDYIAEMVNKQRERTEKDADTGLLTPVGLLNEPEVCQGRNLLMIIHLTNYQDVKNTLGHNYSKTFIQHFVEVMKKRAPDGAICSRYTEDRFVIVLPGINEKKDIQTYWSLFSSLFHEKGLRHIGDTAVTKDYIFTGQAGAVLEQLCEGKVAEAITKANLALRKIADSANNICMLFDSKMQENELNNLRIHQALRENLKEEGFHLVMQPIVKLDNPHTFTEGECLIRWQSPVLGFIPPDEFIGLAERTGMIIRLGNWIIEEACRQLAAFISRGAPPDFKLHINISAVQLQQPDFSVHLLECIQLFGLLNQNICLEITESVLLQNGDTVIQTLNYLRRLGLSVAIDDFGSGYSSLSYLHSLPFDCLKIDRDFVNGVMDNEKSVAVISSVVMLSRCFGVPLVAEGVETAEMAEKLRSLGCEKAQGYYYARPQVFSALDPHNGQVLLGSVTSS